VSAPELGIIEGFFGRPWSWEGRRWLMEALAPAGYGFFLYAPKADAFLRRRWRENHPEAELQALADFAAACRKAGVRCGVGLSPYELHLDLDGPWREVMSAKIADLDAAGVEDLAILFDDMRGDLVELARRQAEIVDFAAGRTRASRIITCPSYYTDDPILDRVFGTRPPGYLRELGEGLDPAVEVMWTGEEVCAREFSPGHLDRVAEEIRRKPFLWDNYPVNDGPRMAQHLHLRAFTGRPGAIGAHVSAHGVNGASQITLGAIPALTLAESYAAGAGYEYGQAWRRAAVAVLGAELAGQVERDLLTLQDGGRDRLGDRQEKLRERYAAFDHPAAREIVDWLDGVYAVTSELQTQ
jgi:hypothetical protein